MASFPVAPNARLFQPPIAREVVEAAAASGLPPALADQLARWFAVAADFHTDYVSLAENVATQVRPREPSRIALAIALAAGSTVYIGRDDSLVVPQTGMSGTNGFLCPSLLVFGPENPLAVYAVSAAGTSLTWLALYSDGR